MLLAVVTLVLGSTLVSVEPAPAQSANAAILTLDPSVRASGMGRASTAVFWGGDTNDDVNPALLGYQQGIRWTHGKTRLIPDLADGVFFKTDRITLGLWGAGVSLVGRPIKGIGRARLGYGEVMATGEDGSEFRTFESHEDLYSFGAGINVIEFAENMVARRLHSPHPFSRYGDVSFGYSTKKADVNLAPSWPTPDGRMATATVRTEDAGLVIRLTPLNTIDGPGILAIDPELARTLEPLGGIRLDVAIGRSVINRGKKLPVHGDFEPVNSLVQNDRRGWAVQGAIGLPPAARRVFQAGGLGFLAEGLSPLIQVGVARDRLHAGWPFSEPDIHNRGWEVTVANILTLRRGHIKDRRGDIIDDTSGWGLGFRVGNYGGFRYDHAVVPQARALGRVKRNGFTIFVRPLEIVAAN